MEMRRLHNRPLHSWVSPQGSRWSGGEKRRSRFAGSRYRSERPRNPVMVESIKDLASFGANVQLWITIHYSDHYGEEDFQKFKGGEGFSRVTETPEIVINKNRPSPPGTAVILASVNLDADGRVGDIDLSMRKYVSPALAPGSVTSVELADQSVTTPKLADYGVTESKLSNDLRRKLGAGRGWVRMTFKPMPLERVIFGRQGDAVTDVQPDYAGFICDVCNARCGKGGARGSMTIPVPAGASTVRTFRIAGFSKGLVEVEIYRGGWDRSAFRGEETKLKAFSVAQQRADGHFDEQQQVLSPITEDHTLAVKVVARDESKIWFVAAEFE